MISSYSEVGEPYKYITIDRKGISICMRTEEYSLPDSRRGQIVWRSDDGKTIGVAIGRTKRTVYIVANPEEGWTMEQIQRFHVMTQR